MMMDLEGMDEKALQDEIARLQRELVDDTGVDPGAAPAGSGSGVAKMEIETDMSNMTEEQKLEAEIAKLQREMKAATEQDVKVELPSDPLLLRKEIAKIERELKKASAPISRKRKEPEASTRRTYCLCRKPYDSTKAMIACDECDNWSVHRRLRRARTSEWFCACPLLAGST